MPKTMRTGAGNDGPETRIRARNKERILNAAVVLFADKSFHGTRMEEIAQASGLPKANVYYYFPTKGSIYTALIERLIEGWDLAFEHIVPEREPRDAITAYIRAKLEYSRRHAADSRLFANEILRGAQLLERRQRPAHSRRNHPARPRGGGMDPPRADGADRPSPLFHHAVVRDRVLRGLRGDGGGRAGEATAHTQGLRHCGGDHNPGHPGRMLRPASLGAVRTPRSRLQGAVSRPSR